MKIISEYTHILPVGDIKEHSETGIDCHCQPKVDFTDLLVIHNAFDNREFDEIEESFTENNYDL